MMQKRPVTLNFDLKIVDGKSVLEAYRTLLGVNWVKPIYGGERVELSDILKDSNMPEWGFKKGVLPEHIKDVYIDVRRNGEVALCYAGRLNHDTERKYWEEIGYSTRTVKKSMEVVDSDGNVLATYGLNRILISRDMFDKFITEMR